MKRYSQAEQVNHNIEADSEIGLEPVERRVEFEAGIGRWLKQTTYEKQREGQSTFVGFGVSVQRHRYSAADRYRSAIKQEENEEH